MTITATVQKGGIMLPPGTPWPDGTRVSVRPVTKRNGAARHASSVRVDVEDPFIVAARKVARPRPHWPKDYVLNHGHYVSGEPKKS